MLCKNNENEQGHRSVCRTNRRQADIDTKIRTARRLKEHFQEIEAEDPAPVVGGYRPYGQR